MRHCEQYNGREINQTNNEANKGLSPSEGSAGSSRVLATQAAQPCCSPWRGRHPPVTQRRLTFCRQTEHAADIWIFNPDNIWWHQSGRMTPPPRWHSWFLWSSTRSGHLFTPSLRSLYCKLFFYYLKQTEQTEKCNNIFRCKVAC